MLQDTPAGMLQLSPSEDADRRAGRIPFLYMLPNTASNLGIQLIGQATSVTARSGGSGSSCAAPG
jgi:hypothetical protein